MAQKKPRKAGDLDDLKQELDIDYHKITPEELYQRFQTHPENVSVFNLFYNFFIKNHKVHKESGQ